MADSHTSDRPLGELRKLTVARIDDLQLTTRAKALLDDLGLHRSFAASNTARLRNIDRLMADLADAGLTYADLTRLTGLPNPTVRKHIRRHRGEPYPSETQSRKPTS
jgi:hypothetical protein